ncbi:MAG: NifU N-terminal domain-containing protein [Phycisphaerales bacterium]|nr:NifU N-terminal domain-containing protein [Phycisphaerales bacterium]
MPYSITRIEKTPNPDALKFFVDPSPGKIPRSYRTPDEADPADELGSGLLAIPGLRTLLIHDGWFSVVKAPEADWEGLKPEIERVLGEIG